MASKHEQFGNLSSCLKLALHQRWPYPLIILVPSQICVFIEPPFLYVTNSFAKHIKNVRVNFMNTNAVIAPGPIIIFFSLEKTPSWTSASRVCVVIFRAALVPPFLCNTTPFPHVVIPPQSIPERSAGEQVAPGVLSDRFHNTRWPQYPLQSSSYCRENDKNLWWTSFWVYM